MLLHGNVSSELRGLLCTYTKQSYASKKWGYYVIFVSHWVFCQRHGVIFFPLFFLFFFKYNGCFSLFSKCILLRGYVSNYGNEYEVMRRTPFSCACLFTVIVFCRSHDILTFFYSRHFSHSFSFFSLVSSFFSLFHLGMDNAHVFRPVTASARDNIFRRDPFSRKRDIVPLNCWIRMIVSPKNNRVQSNCWVILLTNWAFKIPVLSRIIGILKKDFFALSNRDVKNSLSLSASFSELQWKLSFFSGRTWEKTINYVFVFNLNRVSLDQWTGCLFYGCV